MVSSKVDPSNSGQLSHALGGTTVGDALSTKDSYHVIIFVTSNRF